MPPGGNRFGPHGLQNPTHGPIPQYQNDPRLYHPNANQNLGAHPAFGGPAHANGLFGQAATASNVALHGNFGGGGGGFGSNGTGLASHAAQMGFAHGAALQEQQAYTPASHGARKGHEARIREVWRTNLQQEMHALRSMIDRYSCISVDLMFPGVIARPIGNFKTKADYHYQTVRCNADLLKMIQLGITVWTPEGELPPPQGNTLSQGFTNGVMTQPCTWQFNFQFSVEADMASEEYLNMLRKSQFDFQKAEDMGIEPQEFGSLLITSGLVLDDDITWVTFHSGYDFAYLAKIMMPKPLPSEEEQFYLLVQKFFPNYWDGKTLVRQAQKMAQTGSLGPTGAAIIQNLGNKGGLDDLAHELHLSRPGPPHQAGSDSWLCGLVFWNMKQKIFEGRLSDDWANQMWGLNGVGEPASAASRAAALAVQGHGTNANGTMGFHTGGTPQAAHRENVPSTPTTSTVSLASTTPGPHHGHHGAMAGMAGGAFGSFKYPGN